MNEIGFSTSFFSFFIYCVDVFCAVVFEMNMLKLIGMYKINWITYFFLCIYDAISSLNEADGVAFNLKALLGPKWFLFQCAQIWHFEAVPIVPFYVMYCSSCGRMHAHLHEQKEMGVKNKKMISHANFYSKP